MPSVRPFMLGAPFTPSRPSTEPTARPREAGRRADEEEDHVQFSRRACDTKLRAMYARPEERGGRV